MKVDEILRESFHKKIGRFVNDFMEENADCHICGLSVIDYDFYYVGLQPDEVISKVSTTIERLKQECLEKKNKEMVTNFDEEFTQEIQKKIEELNIDNFALGWLLGDNFYYILFGDRNILPGLISDASQYFDNPIVEEDEEDEEDG